MTRVKIGITLIQMAVTLGGLAFSVEDAQAIPAFARKYDMNCNVCHAPVPRLNPYGERFLENGYQLPGTEDGGIIGQKKLGELSINDVGNIVGFRVRGQSTFRFADYKASGTQVTGSPVVGTPHDKAEFIRPDFVSIFVAGTAYKNVGFYVDIDSIEAVNNGELSTNRAFLTVNNIGSQFGAKNWGHLRFGRFDPSSYSAYPLLRQQLDVVFADVVLVNNGAPVGAPIPFLASPIINRFDLLSFAHGSKFYGVYNRQGFPITPTSPGGFYGFAEGVDLHGRPFGDWFLYQVGIVNGFAENFRLVPALGDTNRMKDFYGMVRFDYARSKYFSASLSGFGYFGQNNVVLMVPGPAPGIPGTPGDASLHQYGIQANVRFKMVDFLAAWSIDKVVRLPSGVTPAMFDKTATAITIAMDVRATDQLLLSTRYDFLDGGGFYNQSVLSILPGPPGTAGYTIQRKSTSMVGVQLKYYLRPNIAFMIRDDFNVLNAEGGSTPERNLRNFLTLGFDAVF
jgi:hypothetical protein